MGVSSAALAGRYGELEMPLVIMAGRYDRIVDFGRHSRRLADAAPDAVLIPLENAGHMLHHDVPDKVVDAVELAFSRSAHTDPGRLKPKPRSVAAGPTPERATLWED